jgi:Xaa-Pro dipeptidase
MALHVARDELAERRSRTCGRLAERGLAALLLFRPESHYWLSGYDTFGYVFFQCLVLRADGAMTLLTRAPDLRQARHTSVIEDVRVWVDGADADPAAELRRLLGDLGLEGQRLGIEWDGHGLTAGQGRRLEAALAGVCTLEDASLLVSRLRVIKSPAEIAFVRRAAELADRAFEAGQAIIAPGTDEAEILAAMQGAVFRGDGDYPANSFIIGSGRDALLCRYHAGRRRLDANDQLTLEWAGVFRHYHACRMATLLVVAPSPAHERLFAAADEALAEATAALRPGTPLGDAFAAHERVLDGHGLGAHRMNACGYSLGATFAPSWMDWPMLYAGNREPALPGMVLFLHIIIFDSDRGLAMSTGHTVLIGDDGPEPLTRAPATLIRA